MSNFRNAYTNRPISQGRTYKKPSKTLPNDGLSLRTILTNHSQGLSSAIQKNPEFNPEDSPFAGLDVKKMDLIDLQNLSKHIANLNANANNEIRTKRAQWDERKAMEARVKLEQDAIKHHQATKGALEQP